MIVWCAYCQTFQHEMPPLDSYEITHGICASCAAKGALADEAAVRAIRPIAQFYRRLRERAHAGDDVSTSEILDEARELGIAGIDLLWGMLQPALCEIGALWARNEVTVAVEHRFSANASRIVDAIAAIVPARPSDTLDYLLVNAPDNQHTIGLRMLEIRLRKGGRSTFLVVPGLPAREIVALARDLAPKTLGLSISTPEQADAVREIARELSGPKRPRVIVGGHAVKMGLVADLARDAEPLVDSWHEPN